MKLKEIQSEYKENKNVRISIRCTETNRKFMSKNKISPQLLFDKALEEAKTLISK